MSTHYLNICCNIEAMCYHINRGDIMGINDIVKIGDRIKAFRKKLSLTQEEMADKLQIPRSTYANYESNKREPNTTIIYKICEILDISVNELFENANEDPSVITDLLATDLGKFIFKPSELKQNLKWYPSEEQEALFDIFFSFITSKACQNELGYTENDIPDEIVVELFRFTLEMLHLKISEIQYKKLIEGNFVHKSN